MAVSGTQVRSSVQVTARSYVYLANEITRVFLEAITGFGLDPGGYAEEMPVIERGLRTWAALGQLESAHLEIYDKESGQLRARIDIDVDFRESGDDNRYETDIEAVRRAVVQAGSFPGSAYRVMVTTVTDAAAVSGWSSTTLGPVEHLSRIDVGEVISASSTGAVMSPTRAIFMEFRTSSTTGPSDGASGRADFVRTAHPYTGGYSDDEALSIEAGESTIPVTIYLSDEAVHEQVEAAVEFMISQAGLQVQTRDDPVLGSWFRKMRASIKLIVNSSAGREAMLTAKHVADARLILAQDAYVTSTLLQNLGPVIQSLQPTKDAVVRVGALLIVKIDWQVQVFQLTAAQQAVLDHRPQLATKPYEIIAALQLSTAKAEPHPPVLPF